MARAPSVILTPAEKKLAVNNAKEAAKAAKVGQTTLSKERSKLEKDYAAAVKAAEKAHKTAISDLEKVFKTAVKESDKAIKAADLASVKADADLLKLNASVQAQAVSVKPRGKEVPTETTAAAMAEKATPTETE